MRKPKTGCSKTTWRAAPMRLEPSGVLMHCRRLRPDDLNPVVAIDHAYSHQERRHFFAKRFQAAEAHPEDFVHIGIECDNALVGFALVHLHRGEFGDEQAGAMLDAIGVARDRRDEGIGRGLIENIVGLVRGHGVRSLRSQVDWKNHRLLRFFEASGFELAPRIVLERGTADLLPEDADAGE